MREYELFYLVGESKEAKLADIRSRIEVLFIGAGATFLPPETSDKRRLAYEIGGETRGIYVARRFTLPDASETTSSSGDEDVIARLQRELSHDQEILRVLMVRAEGLPELKPIERTEYAKREVRGRGGRSVPSRPPVVNDTPAPNEDKNAAPVSKEKIDKQLEEVLNI